MKVIGKTLTTIEDILHTAGCLALLAITACINADILMRLGFSIPVRFQFELTEIYLMPMLAMLSLSWVYRDGGHLALELIPEKISGRFGWVIGKMQIILPLIFFAIVTWMSGKFALHAFSIGAVEYGTYDWPLGWAYAAVPLGCGVLVLRLLHDALLGGGVEQS